MTTDSSSLETSPNQRPRRWFRFSLRTVLLAITIVGILLGMFCARYQRAARQKETVELLTAMGATIDYGDWKVVDLKNPFKKERVTRGPEWLRQRLGSHFFDRVDTVALRCDSKSVESGDLTLALQRLRELRHLRELSFSWGTHLKKEDFRLIGDLQQIEELRFYKTDIDDASAAQLSRAHGLRTLRLSEVSISNTGIETFSELPHLEEFILSTSELWWIDSPDIIPSPDSRRYVTDQTVKLFDRFPKLRNLRLYNTAVTNEGIKTLSNLKKLKELTVGSQLVTGDALEYIGGMKDLEMIGTWGWKLEDQHLANLSAMPSLKTLDLLCAYNDPQSCLTDQSIGMISKMEQLTFLRIRGVGITDESLPLLHNMTNLTRLDVDNTSVDKTSQAAKRLSAALPECAIGYPKTPAEKLW